MRQVRGCIPGIDATNRRFPEHFELGMHPAFLFGRSRGD